MGVHQANPSKNHHERLTVCAGKVSASTMVCDSPGLYDCPLFAGMGRKCGPLPSSFYRLRSCFLMVFSLEQGDENPGKARVWKIKCCSWLSTLYKKCRRKAQYRNIPKTHHFTAMNASVRQYILQCPVEHVHEFCWAEMIQKTSGVRFWFMTL